MSEKDEPSQDPSENPPGDPPEDFPIVPPPSNWKTRLQVHTQRLREQLKRHLNRENLQRKIQNFDPQASLEWASQVVQKRGTAVYGTLATILLSTYFLADLTALIVAEYIPAPPISRMSRMGGSQSRPRSINDYNPIFSRNLFNSKGLIPGDENTGNPMDLGGPPVRSTLPLNLIGTLIMTNELRSIATIEDKSASTVYPMRIDDEIPEKIRIVNIEPRRVIFVNKASGRREFIELPEDAQAMNPRITPGRPTVSGGGVGIEKVAPTQYNVSRGEVDRALSDFNKVLTEARAVPNFENGVASGYKLFQIVPGSIYDKLGLQNGDVISGLNGQPINDPGKAFEMLNELKTSSHLELQVKKDGKSMTYSYDIH
jgi:general secretion pathway protein C